MPREDDIRRVHTRCEAESQRPAAPQTEAPARFNVKTREEECCTSKRDQGGGHSTVPKRYGQSKRGASSPNTNKIKTLSQAGKWQEALEELSRLSQHTTQPKRAVFNMVLSSLAKKGAWAQALSLSERMRDQGRCCELCPDNFSHSSVLTALARVGRWEIADEYFRERCWERKNQPNTFVYNSLANAYGRGGQWDRAVGVLNDMKDASVKPDVFTYTTVINACVKANKATLAQEIFAKMKDEGLEPNMVTLTAMLPTYAKTHHWHMALETYEALRRVSKGSPDAQSLCTVTTALSRAKKIGIAEKIVRDNEKCNTVVYNSLLDGYASQGAWEKALEALWDMHRRSLTPDITTYTNMINACSARFDNSRHPTPRPWRLAAAIYNRLSDRFPSPPPSTFPPLPPFPHHNAKIRAIIPTANALLKVLADERENELAEKFLDTLISPATEGDPTADEYSFSLTMRACARAGDYEGVLRVYRKAEECLKNGVGVVEKTAAMKAASGLGSWTESEKIFATIANPDKNSFLTMVRAYEAPGQWLKALSLIEGALRDRKWGLLSTSIFNSAIRCCAAAGQWETALQLLQDLMPRAKIRPTAKTYLALAQVFEAPDCADAQRWMMNFIEKAPRPHYTSKNPGYRKRFPGLDVKSDVAVFTESRKFLAARLEAGLQDDVFSQRGR